MKRKNGRMVWLSPRIQAALELVLTAADSEAETRREIGRDQNDGECKREAEEIENAIKAMREVMK